MPITPVAHRPFSLHPGPRAHGLIGRAAAVTAPLMDPLLGLTALDRLYAELPDGDFIDRALERLGITVDVGDSHLRHVPATGAAIVIANHPTGALDGLAVTHALLRRPDEAASLRARFSARRVASASECSSLATERARGATRPIHARASALACASALEASGE